MSISSSRCARCQRLRLDCEFAPSRRFGRPRRLLKPKETANEGSSPGSDMSSFASSSTTTSTETCGTSPGVDTDIAVEHFEDLSLIETSVASPDDVSVGSCQGASPFEATTSDHTSCSTDASLRDSVHVQDQSVLEISPTKHLYVTPINSTPHLDAVPDIQSIAVAYLRNVHPAHPLLPATMQELLVTLQSTSPLLLSSVACLALPTCFRDLPFPETIASLPDIQAAVFLVCAYYGRGDQQKARVILEKASRYIVAQNWHLIDDASMPPCAEQTEEEREGIRLAFWECWALEVKMTSQTGVPSYILANNFLSVNMPVPDLPTWVDPLDTSADPWALRIRGLSVILTCTTLPPSVSLSSTRSLIDICQDITVHAGRIYIQSFDLPPNFDDNLPTHLAYRETAFVASLIAYCAIIFLYTSSHTSAFVSGGIDFNNACPGSVLGPIRDASAGMFGIFRQSISVSNNCGEFPYPHSPFFDCVGLAAIHGSFLTLGHYDDFGVQYWTKEEVLRNMELTEWVMRRQAESWPCTWAAVDEIRRLRETISRCVSGGFTRLQLEAS